MAGKTEIRFECKHKRSINTSSSLGTHAFCFKCNELKRIISRRDVN